jgi:hypothetical protein
MSSRSRHWQRRGCRRTLEKGATSESPTLSAVVVERIAQFFLETARGDLTRIRHRPVRANGRPAVTIEIRGEDDVWVPHGVSVLEVEDRQIAGIEAFLDPALVSRFGAVVGR